MFFQELFKDFQQDLKRKRKYEVNYNEIILKNKNPDFSLILTEFSDNLEFLNFYVYDILKCIFPFLMKFNKLKGKFYLAFADKDFLVLNLSILFDGKSLYKSLNFDLHNELLVLPYELFKFRDVNFKSLQMELKKAGKYFPDIQSAYIFEDSLKIYGKQKHGDRHLKLFIS